MKNNVFDWNIMLITIIQSKWVFYLLLLFKNIIDAVYLINYTIIIIICT